MPCPLCNSKELKEIEAYTSPGYDIYHCLACDAIFTYPMKSPGREWYEKSQWYNFGMQLPNPHLMWYEKVFLKDKPNIGKGLLLNIGCGKNIFLRLLKDTGYDVSAIDFNEDAIKFARRVLNINNAYTTDALDFARDYNGERFDVITLFEVMEHLDAPLTFIQALKGILKPYGYMVLSVPNRNRLRPKKDLWDYPPHHLTRWSAAALYNFLSQNGFEVIRIDKSPLSAEELLDTIKIYFGTLWLTEFVKNTTNEAGRRFISAILSVLLKFRTIFYNTAALLLRPFIKEGLNLYVIAKNKLGHA